MSLSCLIIDDEPIARQILERYISEVPTLTLSGTCGNAIDAMDFIRKTTVDLIFLDINMPKLSGLNMLRIMPSVPQVIITTAYSKYAVEGFELSVIDYLLKPFSFERFFQAVLKVQKQQPDQKQTVETVQEPVDFIFVKRDKQHVKLIFDEISHIEAYGNYVKIYAGEMNLVPQSLSDLKAKLPQQFIQIHKSYILNFDHVKLVEGNQVVLNNTEKLPIGKAYRKNIADRLK